MTDHSNSHSGLTRRSVLQSMVAAAGASAAGMLADMRPAAAQGAFDWKRYKGTKLEVVLQKSPVHDILQKFEPEFTAKVARAGCREFPEIDRRPSADEIATELGSPKSANMVVLGAYLQKRGVLSPDAAAKALSDVLAARYHDTLATNAKAIQRECLPVATTCRVR